MPSLHRADASAAPDDTVVEFLRQQGKENFFVHPSWVNAVAQCASPGTEPIYAMAGTGERRACLPMLRSRERLMGLPHHTLYGCTSIYTTWYGPACTENQANFAELVEAMVRIERPAMISMDSLDAEMEFFGGIQNGLRSASYTVRSYQHFTNWFERLDVENFEQFMASRTSVLRNTYHRKRRKLLREYDTTFALETDPNKLAGLLDAYETVYRASWKHPEPYPDFVPKLARAAAAAGALRMGALYLDGRPVAAQIWLVAGSSATIFKLAYDDTYKKLSVGTVLTGHIMQHAIDVDGVKEIDFGRGDETYKSQWLTQRRERYGLIAFDRHTLVGNLLRLRHDPPGRILARRLIGRR